MDIPETKRLNVFRSIAGCGDTFLPAVISLTVLSGVAELLQALPLSLIGSQEITLHIFTYLPEKGEANLSFEETTFPTSN